MKNDPIYPFIETTFNDDKSYKVETNVRIKNNKDGKYYLYKLSLNGNSDDDAYQLVTMISIRAYKKLLFGVVDLELMDTIAGEKDFKLDENCQYSEHARWYDIDHLMFDKREKPYFIDGFNSDIVKEINEVWEEKYNLNNPNKDQGTGYYNI